MSNLANLDAGLRRPESDVRITRVFDAPRELVFRMWTEPQHFARWWGPKGFTNPVCELDARPGGEILVRMRAPTAHVYPLTGTFREIVPGERLVFTAIAEDAAGHAALDGIITVTFAAQGSQRPKSPCTRRPMASRPQRPHARRHGEGLGAEPRQARGRFRAKPSQMRRLRMSKEQTCNRTRSSPAMNGSPRARRTSRTRRRSPACATSSSAERRALPWVKVEKNYVFDTTEGKKTLADLFGRNSQLIVHHFMWRHDLDRAAPAARWRPITPKARSCTWRITM